MNYNIKIVKIGIHKELVLFDSKLTYYELQIDPDKCKIFWKISITTIIERIVDMQKWKRNKSLHYS